MEPGVIVALIASAVTAIAGAFQASKKAAKEDVLTAQREAESRVAVLQKQVEEVAKAERECRERTVSQALEMKTLRYELDLLKRLNAELNPTVFITANEDGVILDASDGVMTLLGWRAAELVGRNVDVIIPPDTRERHHAGLLRSRAEKTVRPADIAIANFGQHKSGHKVPVLVSLTIKQMEPREIVAQIVYRRT